MLLLGIVSCNTNDLIDEASENSNLAKSLRQSPFTKHATEKGSGYDVTKNYSAKISVIQIHLYYNNSTTDHFYTKNKGSYSGYRYEGVAFLAYDYGINDTAPIYRYWNGIDHYYSTSSTTPAGYTAEGIEFYAYPSQISGSRPVYQYYGRQRGDHYYTTVQQNYGNYTYEGIAFYIL